MQDNAVTALGAVIRQLSTHIQPTQAAEAISSENQYNNFAVHVVDPKEGVANKKPRVVFYNEQPMRVEDTFWSGKKKLIPDFRRIKTLDEHAVSTPEYLRRTPHDLLEHLLQLARNDLERYRIIFRWQTNKIIRGYRSPRGSITSSFQAIKDGESNSVVTHALIFHELCSMVDLPCEVIRGYVKDASYYPGKDENFVYTSWNVIRIAGQQYICSPGNACERCDRNDRGERNFENRRFNEMSFIAEPNGFMNLYLPHDEKVLQWHPGSKKVKSVDQWTKAVVRGVISCTLGTKLYTTEGVVTAETNVANIKFRFSRDVALSHSLSDTVDGTEYDTHAIQIVKYEEVEFFIRLPHAGKFVFTVFGKARNISENVSCRMPYLVAQYCVVGQGSERYPPFPFSDILGSRADAVNTGFDCINYPPIIETSTCKISLEFTRPKGGEISFQLFHEKRPELKIMDMVYIEPFPQKFALHVALSYMGTYNLRVFSNHNGGGSMHTICASFLIENTSTERASFFVDPNTWGIYSWDHPVKCKDNFGSTIHAPCGESSITFTSPKGRFEDFDLKICSPGRRGTWIEVDGFQRWVFAEYVDFTEQWRMVKMNFRIPRKGFYQLILFYGERSVGRWLISCPSAYEGTLFPKNDGVWGPGSKMTEELGMKCSHPARFNALNGKADFTISVPLTFSDWHVFASLHDIEGPKLIIPKRDLVVNQEKFSMKSCKVYIFHIVLPKTVSKAILRVNIGQENYPGQIMITNSEHGCWLVTATE